MPNRAMTIPPDTGAPSGVSTYPLTPGSSTLACGCAPVASRVGGNPELVEEGRTGMLFDAGNPEQLAQSLRLLVSNVELRRKLGAAAARSIHQNFSLRASAERMADIYHGRLELRRSASPLTRRAVSLSPSLPSRG